MPSYFQANEMQAPALRRVIHLLSPLKKINSGEAIYRHVFQLLADYDQCRSETEHLLAYLCVLLLDSIGCHLPLTSELADELALLKQRLVPPYGKSELDSLRRLVEHFSDSLSNNSSISTDEILAALSPITLPPLNESIFDSLTFPIRRDSEKNSTIETGYNAKKDDEINKPRKSEKIVFNGELKKGGSNAMEREETTGFSQEPILVGIKKTREFNERLANELTALKHTDNSEALENRKEFLIREIENLLNRNRELVDYFSDLTQYLSVLRTHSKRLSNELNKMTALSLTDDLTKLPNRRAFIQRLNDEIGRAKRYGLSLSLALIDLDGFKPINDTHGHAAGDAALRAYAQDILTGFRQNDLIARYGGEEFAVIFPNTESDGAYMALKKVQARAQQTSFEFNRQQLPLPTFSAGLVVYDVGETLEAFVRRADHSLYCAKRNGRNRIELENKPVESLAD